MGIIPRIRLSTAIVLMFLAGGGIWANVRLRESRIMNEGKMHKEDPSITLSDRQGNTMPGYAIVTYTRTVRAYTFGFPMTTVEAALSPEIKVVQLNRTAVAVNVVLGLMFLWAVATMLATRQRAGKETLNGTAR